MVSTSVTGLDVLRAAAEGVVETPPAAALLGWKALALEPGRVCVRYTARAEFGNPQGAIQGGFLAAMLDDAMGPALFTLLEADQFAPTIEIKVSSAAGAAAADHRRGAGGAPDAVPGVPGGDARHGGWGVDRDGKATVRISGGSSGNGHVG